MATAPLIKLEGVGYRQSGKDILSGIDWELESGQSWALLGPNGAGKTTLLNVLVGYLWPTSGRVLRKGQELTDLNPLRRSMGWLSSDLLSHIPCDEASVDVVVSGKYGQFGLKWLPATIPIADDYAQADGLLGENGCEHLSRTCFGNLSQGEQQRVLISRAQMGRPDLLVFDEPCAGMDPGAREQFLRWLAGRLQDADFPTALISTHHIEEIVPVITRVLCIKSGRIDCIGPTAELLKPEVISGLYGTKVARIDCCDGRYWPIWGA